MLQEIILENVSKRFDQRQVLRGVNLTVNKSEVVSIVGRSGCGKTTLLNLVAGLLRPEEGKVLIRGQAPQSLLSARKIGYIFQKAALLPWRTVLENVELPLELFGRLDSGRVMHCIEMVRLKGFENYFPHQLSDGMRTRVGIARALVYEPDLLLMDEPFGNLDDPTRESLYADIQQLLTQFPKTVILVSHNLLECVLLSDRVLVLKGSPACLREEFPIQIFRPRSVDALYSLKVAGYAKVIREALANED